MGDSLVMNPALSHYQGYIKWKMMPKYIYCTCLGKLLHTPTLRMQQNQITSTCIQCSVKCQLDKVEREMNRNKLREC